MRKTNKEERPIKISISTGTIIRVLLLIVSAVLFYFLRDVVIIFIVALLVATIIDPFADWFSKHKMPRGLAVIISYFLILLVLAGVLILVVPTVYHQFSDFVNEYSPIINEVVGHSFNYEAISNTELFNQNFVSVVETLKNSGASETLWQAITIVGNFFGGLLSIILVLILGYYMTVEENSLRSGLELITPKKHQKFVASFLQEGREKVGYWLRGELLLMTLVGLLDFIALSILGIPFALIFAVLGGFLEVVPYLGPNLAALPAVVIAFSISPALAILVALAYFLIQQIESGFLTPKIMQKVVGLNPIVSIVSILIGYDVAGVIGALVAIPVAVLGTVFVRQWILFYKK